MSKPNLVSTEEGKDVLSLVYNNTDVGYISKSIADILLREGYKLESGTAVDGVYGKGNAVLRMIFGVFVKRFKFGVKIYAQGENVRFDFIKGMTGFSGGVPGMIKMTKELKRLSPMFKALS